MRTDSQARYSATERLVLMAIAAVLLPAVVLAVFQYRQSRELQSKTEIAAKEHLRETLTAIANQTEQEMVEFADEAFRPINGPLSIPQASKVAEHFANISRSHPEVSELFVVATCPVCGQTHSSYVFSGTGAQIVKDPNSDQHLRWLTDIFNAEQSASDPDRDRRKLFFWQTSCGCAKRPPVYVIRQVTGGFVGLSLDTDYIQRHELSRFLASAETGGTNGRLAISVLGEDKKEIFASALGAQYDMVIPFAPVFPRWQLAAGYNGMTIAGLARRNFQSALLLDGMMVVFLLAGILFTLRAAAREMRLAQAKSSFVSNVSHELKTPLALIRLFVETLELGRVKSKDKEQEYCRIIHNESRRLTQLINNILDFSKIEAGKREYQFSSCDIASIVQEVLDAYEYQISSSGFELKTYIAATLLRSRVDADALAQAVLNLLSNALKYSGDSRQVEVRVEQRNSSIAIEIADRGIGIPKAEHEKIFEKFYRVSMGLVHATKGSGLGLALVKHIVDAHGGKIVVDSAPGKGSRFTILLPVDTAAAPARASDTQIGGYVVAESPNR